MKKSQWSFYWKEIKCVNAHPLPEHTRDNVWFPFGTSSKAVHSSAMYFLWVHSTLSVLGTYGLRVVLKSK